MSAMFRRVWLGRVPLALKMTRQETQEASMPKYVIERDIPGVGGLSASELQAISMKSCGVLQELGPQIQWIHSYVTGDKVYCVYIAPNEAAIGACQAGRLSGQSHFPGPL